MTKRESKYVGVDGCKAGWLSVGLDDGDDFDVKVFAEFGDLLEYYANARLILVDIPIGLPCPGPEPRACDAAARKKLGNRHSTVFRAPIREVAQAVYRGETREKASELSERSKSKRIGSQAYGIIKKIAEVDKALRISEAGASPMVREVHPEVCFWSFNKEDKAAQHRKDTPEGVCERLDILGRACQRTWKMYDCARAKFLTRRNLASCDDILDALVAAVTAKLGCTNPEYELRTLPECPSKDCKGLCMEMVYAIKKSD